MEFKIRIRADGTAEVVNDLGQVKGELREVGQSATDASREARPAMKDTGEAVKEAGQEFDTTRRSAGGFLDRLTDGRAIVSGFIAVLGGLASKRFLGALIDEQSTYEQNMLRTEALIKATGEAAGFTAQELRAQARELALGTLESVEGVERAQQRLMAFTSVTGENFSRTIELAADLAALTGGDLSSAVAQLGRALEDPTRGLDGLTRAGVTFTAEQKEVIEALAESGRAAEAQAMILDVVAGKFDGLARAQAEGWAGVVDTMGQALSEARLGLAEYFDVGQRAGEVVKQLAGYVFEFNENLKAGEYDAVISGMGAIVKVAGVYLGLVTGIKAAQAAAIVVTQGYAAALWLVGGGASAAAAGLGLMQKALLPVMALLAGWELGKWARENFGVVEKAGIVMASSIHRAIVWLKGEFDLLSENMKFALTSPLDFARGKIADFFEWIQGLGKTALRFLGLDGLADMVRTDFDAVRGAAAAEHEKALQTIRSNTMRELGQVKSIYDDMFDQVGKGADRGAQAAGKAGGEFRRMSLTTADAFRTISDIVGTSTGTLTDFGNAATVATRDLGREVDALRRRIDPAWRAVSDLADAEFLLWEAAAAGIISQQELADMLALVHVRAEEAAEPVRALAAEAGPFTQAWEEATKRIDQVFADAWRGAFDSFRAFARGLGNAFKQLLAELAHAAITRPILVSLGLVAGGAGNAMAGVPGAGGAGSGMGFNPLSFLSGGSIGNLIGGGLFNVGSFLGSSGLQNAGFNLIGQGLPNWHFGVAGLLGGLAGNALFGGQGYSGLGSSIGAMAGYGIGSSIGALGALGGPVGAVLGTLAGGLLGSLLGGNGERFPRTVGSSTGTWSGGTFTAGGPDTGWQHAGEDPFGDDMDRALTGLQENFSARLAALFNAFDLDDSIDTTVRVRLRRTSGRLVGTFFGTLGDELEESFRIHGQYGKDAKIQEAFEQFAADVLSKGIVAAIEASALPEHVKRMFDGLATPAEVDAAIASIVHFQDLITRDVIGQAARDFELAGRTATEVYREQFDAVLDLAAGYDGTLAGTRALSVALEQHQAMAYQLATALHQVSAATQALFGSLGNDIRESMMSERQLYDHRKAQVDALVEAMTTMTDPAQIMATAEQIERLTREMWGSLDESQRQRMAGGYLQFLEEINALTQQQIAAAREALEQDQEQLGDTIDDSLVRIAAQFDDAAEQQLMAARQIREAADDIHDAAKEIAFAAGRLSHVEVDVRVKGEPVSFAVREVGG